MGYYQKLGTCFIFSKQGITGKTAVFFHNVPLATKYGFWYLWRERRQHMKGAWIWGGENDGLLFHLSFSGSI